MSIDIQTLSLDRRKKDVSRQSGSIDSLLISGCKLHIEIKFQRPKSEDWSATVDPIDYGAMVIGRLSNYLEISARRFASLVLLGGVFRVDFFQCPVFPVVCTLGKVRRLVGKYGWGIIN